MIGRWKQDTMLMGRWKHDTKKHSCEGKLYRVKKLGLPKKDEWGWVCDLLNFQNHNFLPLPWSVITCTRSSSPVLVPWRIYQNHVKLRPKCIDVQRELFQISLHVHDYCCWKQNGSACYFQMLSAMQRNHDHDTIDIISCITSRRAALTKVTCLSLQSLQDIHLIAPQDPWRISPSPSENIL